jgi:hypothetical protein
MKIPQPGEIWREKESIIYIDFVTIEYIHYAFFSTEVPNILNINTFTLQCIDYFLEQFIYDNDLTEKFQNENIIQDIIE